MSDDISINIETPMSLRTIVERIPIGLDVYAESSDPLKDTWENFVLPHVNKEDLDHYKTLWNTIVRKGPSIKPKLKRILLKVYLYQFFFYTFEKLDKLHLINSKKILFLKTQLIHS